jgi:hypothetical protein
MTLAFSNLMRAPNNGKFPVDAVLGGVWWMAAAMTKPSLALLGPAFIALYLWQAGWRDGRAWRMAAVAVLAFAVAMSPWWWRNYRVFGAFVPLSTMGGFTLYESNGPGADGGPNFGKTPLPDVPGFDGPITPALELARNRAWSRAAREAIFADPARFLRLAGNKFGRTWSLTPNWSGAQHPLIQFVSAAYFTVLMPLCAVAMWRRRQEWRSWLWLALPAIYIAVIHSVFMGSVRYRLPAEGALAVLAALALVIPPGEDDKGDDSGGETKN